MDPIHTCVALLPLSLYLLLLGLINLVPRPIVLSGSLDLSLLGFGVAGLMMAGPMDLFWPEAAAARFGPYVWIMLLALYALMLTLLVLLSRPRIVVYNVRADDLRGVLSEVATRLDTHAAWVGESLHLPSLGVQMHLEPFTPLRNVQLVSTGGGQSYGGWQEVLAALRRGVPRLHSHPNPYGAGLVLCSFVLFGVVSYWLVTAGPTVASGLFRMLRLAG